MRVEAKKHGQIFNYFINQGVQIMTKDMTMGSPLRMILLFSISLSCLSFPVIEERGGLT